MRRDAGNHRTFLTSAVELPVVGSELLPIPSDLLPQWVMLSNGGGDRSF